MTTKKDDQNPLEPLSQPANEETSAALAALEAKLAEAETALAAAEEKHLRALADLQNLRRRATEERVELLRNGGEDVIRKLLPVLDNFERAAKTLPAELRDNAWVKGILTVEKSFFEMLGTLGLSEIAETGGKLDPLLHEPLVVDPAGAKDTVLEILEKGYMLNGKVLRAAKVKAGG